MNTDNELLKILEEYKQFAKTYLGKTTLL